MGYRKKISSRVKGSFERGQEEGRHKIRVKKEREADEAEEEYVRGYHRPSKVIEKLGEISVAAEEKLHKSGKTLKKTKKVAKKVGRALKPVGKAIYDVAERVTRPPAKPTRNPYRVGSRSKPSIFDDDFDDEDIGWRGSPLGSSIRSSRFRFDDDEEEYRPFGRPFGKTKSQISPKPKTPSYYSPEGVLGVGMVKNGQPHLIGDIPYQSYGSSSGGVSAILGMGKSPHQRSPRPAYKKPELLDAPSFVRGASPKDVSAILSIGKTAETPKRGYVKPQLLDIAPSRSRPATSIESILGIGVEKKSVRSPTSAPARKNTRTNTRTRTRSKK
jgi:hypothetical protein